MSEEEKGTINSAISALVEYIDYNQSAGRKVMLYLVTVSSIAIGAVILPSLSQMILVVGTNTPPNKPILNETLLYVTAGIFVVVFGVLMAVYRFHLNEIAKATHYKIGFMRIRVAANNYNREGFLSDVRQSLTERAFDYSTSSLFAGKDKKVNSPLPGHPTSDISTMILNKLLEGFELKKKS